MTILDTAMNGDELSTAHRPSPPVVDDHSLPEPFISSLRQLFSILDKTNSGSVPFEVFKRYFDGSSCKFDFLNELEIEAKSHQNLITFHLLINVIKRSLSCTKSPPPILIRRSTSMLVVSPKAPKFERQIPIVYRSSHRLETKNNNASNPMYYHRDKRIDFPMV